MDHETNNEKPSSTEGGEMSYKVGDKVWVLCEVAMVYRDRAALYMDIRHDNAVFEAKRSDCRPVEPSNSPEIPDSPIEPMRAAFEADSIQRNGWNQGYFGRNENRYFDSSVEMAWQAFQAGAKYQSDQIEPEPVKQFVLVTDNDGNQTLYVDGVLHNGDNTVYGCDVADAANGCAIKIELRDVDLIVDDWPLRLNDFGVEAKQPESSPLAPSPCMDGVDVDQFIEGVAEARGRTSDPINPSHYKHLPAEAIDIIEAAIAKAPSNQYAFLQGQVIKYLLRCWSKKGIEDLRKAKWYLDRLVGEFDDLLAETSGANDGPKRKQYRTPTLADLANGPIACECRGTQLDDWQPQMLFEMLRETAYPYRASCPKNQHKITRWSQCRIEASE
jgi:hypothetical protein